MLVKKPDDIKSSEITDKSLYLNRRTFMRGVALASTTLSTGLLYRWLTTSVRQAEQSNATAQAAPPTPDTTGEELTSYKDITNYNNFYEFSTNKQAVAAKASSFVTRPWTVAVEGLVHKPKVYDLEDLLKLGPLEDRTYRLRCVEGWSMVIPWLGLPLARLLERAEPTSAAGYVQFETFYGPDQMPNQRTGILEWPYVEGLRMDEALHPLTILAFGLYGEMLPPQNGAPIRLVVPWKYGFKGIKSIVKVRLVEDRPPTTWNIAAPHEYGFYSNVNPEVDHPRWSQARERRIGEYGLRDTLMFNGYADQVAHMYEGMDLNLYY